MIVTGYKLVINTGDGYRSLMAVGKYELQYPIGSIVKPLPNTVGIMIFSSFPRALDHLIPNSIERMLEVEYDTNAVSKPDWISLGISQWGLDKFYSTPVQKLSKLELQPIMPGTVCCDWVRVIREVTP